MTNGSFANEKAKQIRIHDMIIHRDSIALVDNGLHVLYTLSPFGLCGPSGTESVSDYKDFILTNTTVTFY